MGQPTSADSSVDTTAPRPTEPGRTDPDRHGDRHDDSPHHVSGPDDHGAVGDTADRNGIVDDRATDERASRARHDRRRPVDIAPAHDTDDDTAPTTSPTTTVAPPPEPFTQSYSSAGGSITVRWDGAALTLLDVTPAAGFDQEVEDERPDRIRVRFQDDAGGDFRIEIRVENGQIVRVE